MKPFVISCLVLLLAVCIVKKAEGFYDPKEKCNEDCDALEDLCIGSRVPQHACDKVIGGCRSVCWDKQQKKKH